MDLKKVYNSTEDVFDSADSIYQLFNFYFNSEDKSDFIAQLRDTESDFMKCFAFAYGDETLKFLEQDSKMHCILFNKWLNDIRRIARLSVDEKNKFFERVSDASRSIKSNSLKDGIINSYRVKTAFNKIANKVKKMGSISSSDQIDSFEQSFSDPDVTRVMEILNYFSVIPFNDEVRNIRTNALLAEEPIKARDSVFLAFIPQKLDIYAFINSYLEKCIKYKLPYNIDIPYDERTKRLVKINSTIDNFGKNLAIIKEIADENPEIIQRMEKPPILCGHISHNSWIGIGTYSCKEIERTKYGYTEKRANIIYDVNEKKTREFIVENYKKPMVVNGKKGKLKDHVEEIAKKICLCKIRTMADDYYETMLANHDSEEAEKEVKNFFGFERKDLYSPKYLKKLEKNIAADIDRMVMSNFENDKDYGSFRLPNPGFGTGKILHMDILPTIIKKVSADIAIKDPVFLSQTLLEIQEQLQANGINKKSCYEDYVAEKMLEENREVESENDVQGKSNRADKGDKEER